MVEMTDEEVLDMAWYEYRMVRDEAKHFPDAALKWSLMQECLMMTRRDDGFFIVGWSQTLRGPVLLFSQRGLRVDQLDQVSGPFTRAILQRRN